MPVPSSMADLSNTAASNSPAGSESVFPDLDNYLRAHAAFISQLRAATATAVSALDIDCSQSTYFTKTISANSTFTFSNPPASGRAFAFTLELTHTSGTVTWPTTVRWPAGTAPTLTTGKTHLFIFVTDDGGTIWRGASLVDYTST